jgi:hypothetical protein
LGMGLGCKDDQANTCSMQIIDNTKWSAACAVRVCDEGTYQCDGSVLSVCHNNAWVRLADCRNYQLHCNSDAKLKTGSCI